METVAASLLAHIPVRLLVGGGAEGAAMRLVGRGGDAAGLTLAAALGGPVRKGFLFLVRLAWESRVRLPVLITVAFMALDIRMQLEINVNLAVRRIPRLVVEHDEEDDLDEDDDVDEDDEEDEEGDEEDDDEEVSSSGSEGRRQRPNTATAIRDDGEEHGGSTGVSVVGETEDVIRQQEGTTPKADRS